MALGRTLRASAVVGTVALGLVDVRPVVRLLSTAGLGDLVIDARVTPHPPRAEGYWTAFVIPPGRHGQPATIEVAVDVTGPDEALGHLYGICVVLEVLTYGPEGERQQVRSVVLAPGDADLDPTEIVRRHALPHARPGDIITLGETPLAVMPRRFYEPTQLRPSWISTRMAQFMSGVGALGTLVALVAGRFLLPSSKNPTPRKLDPLGAVRSILALVVLLWGVIEAPSKGWGNGEVIASFVFGVLLLASFIIWELRCDHPMLNIRFFQNRRFSAANAGITMVFFAMFGAMFLISQYLQTVLGFSALEAGLRMLPMACVMLVVAPMAPRIVERVGTKVVMGSGLSLAAIGLFWASRVPETGGYPHLFVAMAILSAGMGLTMAPATESIMGSLPPSQAGVGSAMNDTTRQMGGALGVAILGSVLATSYRPGIGAKLTDLGVPGHLIATAKDSVGGALQAATDGRLTPSVREAMETAARSEFVNAFGGALVVGALAVAAGAAIVLIFLPARAHDARESGEGPLDGLASLTFAEAEGVLEADAAGLLADGVRERP